MSDLLDHQLAAHPVADLVDRLAALCRDATLAAAVTEVATALRREPAGGSEPLDRVVAAFGLSRFERDALVLVGLPEEHEALSHLARVLHPRGEPRLSFAGIATALALDLGARRYLREAIDAGPLRRHRLVVPDGAGPLPECGLRLTPGLWSVLRGHDHWPEGLRPRRSSPLSARALPPARLRAALDGGAHVVVVTGDAARPPSELAAIVCGAAEGGGTAVVAVAADDLTDDAASALSVHAAARGAHPVIVGRPASPPLPGHPGPVVVCVEGAAGLPLDDRPVVALDLGERPLDESIAMWEQLVPELNGAAERLAGVLRVDHVRAARAVADARATARAGGDGVTAGGIVRHARRRTGSDLPASVRIVRPSAGWNELVTTPANADLLRSLVDRVHGQVRVLHEWGFGARASRGVRALFSGPPGTGKTLSAEVLASSLDLDLLVVDLSALVSKWLGETEKNISEVFAAAERSHAVLFFDEADALFGRRTDGNDAQGRWANLETAHLLGRIDDSDGLVILATNLRGNIDDAFLRRLDVVVEFGDPGPEERLRLWSGHLPPAAPLADDIDLRQLSYVYELTGALISNAALAAAFRAAAANRPIDQRTLIDAVDREYQKAGRSFPGIPRGLADVPTGGT